MSKKTKYFINMNDGRVIAGTEETLGNIFYKEIHVSWAIAIRDGKIGAKKVIEAINAKIGVMPFSDMMEAIGRLNVRSKDLHMEEHARGEIEESGGEDAETDGVLGKFSTGKAGRITKEAKGDLDKKVGAAITIPDEAKGGKSKSQSEAEAPADGEGDAPAETGETDGVQL